MKQFSKIRQKKSFYEQKSSFLVCAVEGLKMFVPSLGLTADIALLGPVECRTLT